MCPFCLASMGLIVASATSAGGLTALAVKLYRKKSDMKEISKTAELSQARAGNQHPTPAK
jgi:hypothetical protein